MSDIAPLKDKSKLKILPKKENNFDGFWHGICISKKCANLKIGVFGG